MNWSLYIICQNTIEPLKCPLHKPIAGGDHMNPSCLMLGSFGIWMHCQLQSFSKLMKVQLS